MKEYTITTRDGSVQFALCATHQHAAPREQSKRCRIAPASAGVVCEVCRQDRIRAAIRSVWTLDPRPPRAERPGAEAPA